MSSWSDKLRGGAAAPANQSLPSLPSLGDNAPALPSSQQQQQQQQQSPSGNMTSAAAAAASQQSKASHQNQWQKKKQEQDQKLSENAAAVKPDAATSSSSSVSSPAGSSSSTTAAAPAASVSGGNSKFPFDYYVVLDFEATCDEGKRLQYQEIIEFPSLLVDAHRSVVVSEFQRYVRPIHNPVLSRFCSNLTGIPQLAVDEAPFLPQVWAEYMAWLRDSCGFDPIKNSARFCWVTCGDWDLKTMLPTQLRNPRPATVPAGQQQQKQQQPVKIDWGALPKQQPEFLQRWVNLKQVYQRIAQRRISGMTEMAAFYNVPLGGLHHHSGIDDCRGIAKCLIALLRRGYAVDLTSGSLSQLENAQKLQSDYAAPLRATFAPSLAAMSKEAVAAMASMREQSKAWQDQDQQQQKQKAAAGSHQGEGPNAPPNSAAAAAAASAGGILLGPLIEMEGTSADVVQSVLGKGTDPRSLMPKDANEITALSKRLSSALRHNAVQWRIPMSLNGWVRVRDLLRNNRFHQCTPQQLALVVAASDKQRFALGVGAADSGANNKGELFIRANQGHSIADLVVDMEKITDPQQVPMAVHGTNVQAWEKIRTQGLNRMGRQHVHFAAGLPGEDGVVSGMRAKSQVLVYLDVKKSLDAGLKLYKSANSVILTPGFDGVVPPALFAKAVDASTGRTLSF